MGRPRRHSISDLKAFIIEAAAGMVETCGADSVTARNLSSAAGISVGTLYCAFPFIDDVFVALEVNLLRRLIDRLSNETAVVDTSRQRLSRLASSYLEFSRESPQLWALCSRNSPKIEDYRLQDLKAVYGRIVDCFELALSLGIAGSGPRPARDRAIGLWASIHSLSVLAASGKHPGLTPDIIARNVEAILAAYAPLLEMGKAVEPAPM